MRARTGDAPILLLDDVLSELDAERAGGFLAAVGGFEQAFLTTTELPARVGAARRTWAIRAATVDARASRKLGGVLDGWRPKPGPGADPLVAVRAAWVELVGADVARAAQPVAIERDTLIVLTGSSAWSAPARVPRAARSCAGCAALPETRELTRLRFRVGKLRRPLRGPARPARAAQRAARRAGGRAAGQDARRRAGPAAPRRSSARAPRTAPPAARSARCARRRSTPGPRSAGPAATTPSAAAAWPASGCCSRRRGSAPRTCSRWSTG